LPPCHAAPQGKGEQRVVKIVASPYKPESEASFQCSATGVTDYKDWGVTDYKDWGVADHEDWSGTRRDE
jgi:hypothetical protein